MIRNIVKGAMIMKTLYISDLDGTLLNSNAELSDRTINTLNQVYENGIPFTIATARTAATAVHMLQPVKINTPAILMNGVLIYDFVEKKYIKKELLSKDTIKQIIDVINAQGQTGLMYTLENEKLNTYYERLDNLAIKSFVDERIQKYNKRFTQIDDFRSVDTQVIYFCFLNDSDSIHRLYNSMSAIDGLRIEMYKDIYSDDLWYLEVFSETASKYNAVQYLRKHYGFDKVVGFGDNLNDLPLFAACDECYAVANARSEVKEMATGIIRSNEEDGVVRWLEEAVIPFA
jgi:Cof subfamily protein (haloacid dehalogenase superfamily)